MKEKEDLIKLINISFAYPSRENVLNELDFNLFRGERVGLVGSNGSGKTT